MRCCTFISVIALSCATVFGPIAANPVAPATQPAADDLFAQALAAFASADYANAAGLAAQHEAALRKAKARPADPAVINAVHLQAVAMLHQGQPKNASDAFQRIYASVGVNRSLLVNISVCDISQGELAARAIRNLQGYAAAHPEDEFVLNLLGRAIDDVDRSGKQPTKVKEYWAAYAKANAVLEATRKGERRWGSEWKNASEVAELEAVRLRQQRLVDDASADLKRSSSQLERAESDYSAAKGSLMGRRGRAECRGYYDDCVSCNRRRAEAAMRSAEAQIARWRPEVEIARTRRDRELAAMPRPTFAVSLQPIEIELLK